ncbi:hypothetical protein HMPREF1084_02576 [Clostridium butyricum 60E.3]|uniref:TRADD-N-associated membrane domain-containing protein n=1 Tax=Clostridium butyricum TaxID=1492 RepID=UPI0002D1C36E|nr:hypothetical protein [Clostridium butyricum]ENZ32162.1 hypothetical protein HMPREF1084_02576 [Clostridium butyricum 60E.3]
MNLNAVFLIILGIIISSVVIIIILLTQQGFKKEKEKLKNELEEYKKEYADNIEDVGLKIMSVNLLELKEYYTMNKIQYERTFIITTFFSSIGCLIIFIGLIYGSINQNLEIARYTTISGGVSEGVAALAFWMFTQAKNQLNLYSTQLRDNERILCAINIARKNDTNVENTNINKIISYLLRDSK